MPRSFRSAFATCANVPEWSDDGALDTPAFPGARIDAYRIEIHGPACRRRRISDLASAGQLLIIAEVAP